MPKDELLNALHLEFVNRVNEIGVDVNRCVNHPHTSSLIQFVCGLGPRKGYNLLKVSVIRSILEQNLPVYIFFLRTYMCLFLFIC